MNDHTVGFRHPARLTHATTGMLCAYVAMAFFSILKSGGNLFGYTPDAWLPGPLVEDWERIAAGVAVGSLILLLVWTRRANQNVRALGASGLRFTPGGAVGWYFVPIAWFWKPYQAMTEIWKASARPADWKHQRGSVLLGWWWGLWLLASWGAGLASEVAIRKWGTAGAAAADFGRGLVAIPAALVLIAIITSVHRMQTDYYLGD